MPSNCYHVNQDLWEDCPLAVHSLQDLSVVWFWGHFNHSTLLHCLLVRVYCKNYKLSRTPQVVISYRIIAHDCCLCIHLCISNNHPGYMLHTGKCEITLHSLPSNCSILWCHFLQLDRVDKWDRGRWLGASKGCKAAWLCVWSSLETSLWALGWPFLSYAWMGWERSPPTF